MSLHNISYYHASWVALALFLAMLVAAEAGFRLGKRRPVDEHGFAMLGVLQGAMLGLLALLLAFSFSLASERYDLRRRLMVDEAAAIGTTYLRTSVLPPEAAAEMRRLLRVYVGERIERLDTQGDESKFVQTSELQRRTQQALWRIAVTEARERRDDSSALLVEALNETIDLSQAQLGAHRNHIPPTDVAMLTLTSILSALTLGYGFGACARRLVGASVVFCAMVAALAYTILDFDRPDRGLVRVPDDMLRDLAQDMAGESVH